MIIDIPTVEGGEFIDGGPNTLGTIVTAAFLNAVMKSSVSTTKEIQTVLIKTGINPNSLVFDQLYKAIELMIINQLDAQPISNGYSSTRKYKTGSVVYVDGMYYEAYHPDGCLGKDPRDNANRPSGWVNQDVHAPYHWIEIGKYLMLPEIGSPIYLMTMNHREGLMKLKNDTQLSADKFWRLAELNKNLVSNRFLSLVELRANVIRALDDGRGIDVGRVINSYQVDAMQKITGSIGNGGDDSGMGIFLKTRVTGAFRAGDVRQYSAGVENRASNDRAFLAEFDSSLVTRTNARNETVMKNIAMLACIRF